MIFFVHVGFDPEPKKAETPIEAINLAEQYLNSVGKKLSSETNKIVIKWRRDELYPDNLLDYTTNDLIDYLNTGEVVLQLVKLIGDDVSMPIMGEIVNILTLDEETKNIKEADKALKISHQMIEPEKIRKRRRIK